MIYILSFVIFLGILMYVLFHLINKQFTSSSGTSGTSSFKRASRTDLTNIYKNIRLQPYGCFSSLDEKFFLKQINPYSNDTTFDSGIIISESKRSSDMRNLIQQVINNGYDKFAYEMLSKYDKDPDGYSKNMDIINIGILGKLAGYNYLSVYKLNEHVRGKIYLTYSPPMDDQLGFGYTDEEYTKNLTKNDLPGYTLTPKLNNYTNEDEKAPGKELACGYPCLPYDKPMTFTENGVTKQYMCGSVGFPNIKTPTRFAVYKIIDG